MGNNSQAPQGASQLHKKSNTDETHIEDGLELTVWVPAKECLEAVLGAFNARIQRLCDGPCGCTEDINNPAAGLLLASMGPGTSVCSEKPHLN